MTDLLDANVLVALSDSGHVHHDVVERWLAEYSHSPPAR